jgi:hypothetical protein
LREGESQLSDLDSQHAEFPVLSSQAGETRITTKVIRDLDARLSKRNIQRLSAYRDLLQGALALNDGQPKKALPYLQAARANWDAIVVRDLYAHALFECERWEEAEREFREITQLKGRSLNDPMGLMIWKVAPYWAARSVQAEGRTAAARQAYTEFLASWSADDRAWLVPRDAARRLQAMH